MVALEAQGDRKKVEEIKYKSLLVRKLAELGYKKLYSDYLNNINYYIKNYENVKQVVCIDCNYEVLIHNYYVEFNRNITSQKDLDNIQIAFNRIQSDMKMLYGAQYE